MGPPVPFPPPCFTGEISPAGGESAGKVLPLGTPGPQGTDGRQLGGKGLTRAGSR
jgi:hypothetical protein